MLMTQAAYARRIGMSKQYVNKMVKLGVIVLVEKKVNPTQADQALKEYRDPARDPQREANAEKRSGDTLFDDANVPEKSLATMSQEERAKYDEELQASLSKLKDKATTMNIDDLPDLEGSAKEWNTYKIKEQGLTYALKRRQLEGELITVDDSKAAFETLLAPLNKYLDDLGNSIKNHFPDVDDEVIDWVSCETNRQKELLQGYAWEQ